MSLIDVRRPEWTPLAWAAGWFFCVLASYYAIRPVRDAYGVDAGPDGLRWLFTATFAAMLVVAPVYGRITILVPKAWLPPIVYGFFAANLVAFWGALTTIAASDAAWLQWAFYVWVSVFNLYAVTLFWSVAVDRFTAEQAKRLFGVAAGAGTLGGLAGSEAARWIVRLASVESVLWLSAALLLGAILCAWQFRKSTAHEAIVATADPRHEMAANSKGSLRAAAAGLVDVIHSPYLAGIAALMILSSLCGTSIYMQMSDLVGQEIASPSARADWYARLNNYQNMLTLVGQTAAASWLIRRWGLAATLTVVPVVYAVGFTAIAGHPTLALLGALDVAQRVASFAVGVPAREVLFTTVGREEKYRAKALIDTVGKRGGDTMAAHGYALLRTGLHWTPAAISLAMLPVAGVMAAVSAWLGLRHARQSRAAADASAA